MCGATTPSKLNLQYLLPHKEEGLPPLFPPSSMEREKMIQYLKGGIAFWGCAQWKGIMDWNALSLSRILVNFKIFCLSVFSCPDSRDTFEWCKDTRTQTHGP